MGVDRDIHNERENAMVILKATGRRFSSEQFRMGSVPDAIDLGDSLEKAYEDFDRISIVEDGHEIAHKERTTRYEWQDAEVSAREVNSDADHMVWAWAGISIAFHASFAGEYDAMQFATMAMRANGVNHVQVESPDLGKITDWKKGNNHYWGEWVDTPAPIVVGNSEPISAVNV